MAEVKKAKAIVKAPVKAPVKDGKAEEVKAAEIKAEVKNTSKAEVKELPKAAEKEPAKKAVKAPAKKAAAAKKEETVKKAPGRKSAVKEAVHFQFNNKSYTPDDLLKSCKDVWKYDLGGKEEDIKSIELYVKPEENTTYYVINGDVTGSFFI